MPRQVKTRELVLESVNGGVVRLRYRRTNVHRRALRGHWAGFPVYFWLLPHLRDLSMPAQLLYVLLRHMTHSARKTPANVDENGDVFVLCDESKLAFYLNVATSTVRLAKRELERLGLIDVVRAHRQVSQIYVMDIGALKVQFLPPKISGKKPPRIST